MHSLVLATLYCRRVGCVDVYKHVRLVNNLILANITPTNHIIPYGKVNQALNVERTKDKEVTTLEHLDSVYIQPKVQKYK